MITDSIIQEAMEAFSASFGLMGDTDMEKSLSLIDVEPEAAFTTFEAIMESVDGMSPQDQVVRVIPYAFLIGVIAGRKEQDHD